MKKSKSKDGMPYGMSTTKVCSIRLPKCVWEHFENPSTEVAQLAIDAYRQDVTLVKYCIQCGSRTTRVYAVPMCKCCNDKIVESCKKIS